MVILFLSYCFQGKRTKSSPLVTAGKQQEIGLKKWGRLGRGVLSSGNKKPYQKKKIAPENRINDGASPSGTRMKRGCITLLDTAPVV
jgi:hypothetical protein